MATFKIGQRVRIKYTLVRHDLLGAETIVTGIINVAAWGWPVGDYVGTEVDIRNDTGQRMVAVDWQLEPIQDEGRKVVSWGECLWQPTREDESVCAP